MKKMIRKAALLVLAAVTLGLFASCNSDDDDDNCLFDLRLPISGTKVATFVATTSDDDLGVKYTNTVYFYTDSSKNQIFQSDLKMQRGSQVAYYTEATGTYTGDPTKDGDVTIKVTKAYDFSDDDYSKLEEEDVSYSWNFTITNGKINHRGVDYVRQ